MNNPVRPMKFLVEIEGDDAVALTEMLDEARKRIVEGGCHLNTAHWNGNVRLSPADASDEAEFDRQYHLAHPAVPSCPKARA